MTSEQLLDIIGLLDDDLIQEAERYPAQIRTARYRQWISLAACLAIVLVLGYGATHMGMGGGGAAPAGSSGCAAEDRPAASAPAARPPADGEVSFEGIPSGSGQPDLAEPGAQGGAAGGSTSSGADASFTPSGAESSEPAHYIVFIDIPDGNTHYTYRCRFDGVTASDPQVEVPQIETLPEGCRSLGRLRQMQTEEDFQLPHSDSGWYTGCPLWIQGEGWEGPLYLELPQGGYLVFEYSQTRAF